MIFMKSKEEILAHINTKAKETLMSHLDIKFTDIGEDTLTASMPVCSKTIQPYGTLHGGASVALAESVGGAASFIMVDAEKFIAYGIEINANHIKPVKSGYVHAKATLLHKGEKTHVWDIKITDDNDELISVCRLTNMIVAKHE